VEKTWKPIAAAVICIIAGAIGLIPVIWVALMLPLAGAGSLGALGPLLISVGIIQIAGGIFGLRRRIGGLALAGSILALIVLVIIVVLAVLLLAAGLSEGLSPLPAALEILARMWYLIIVFAIPGILSIRFVIMGKREFRRSSQPLLSQSSRPAVLIGGAPALLFLSNPCNNLPFCTSYTQAHVSDTHHGALTVSGNKVYHWNSFNRKRRFRHWLEGRRSSAYIRLLV
jgi:hypothetical protein